MGVKVGDKIMKRILSALIMMTLILSATGCGTPQKTVAETENVEQGQNETATGSEEKNSKTDRTLNSSNDTSKGSESAEEEKQSAAASLNIIVPAELDKAVGRAIIDNNTGNYLEGECNAEGHIVMDIEDYKTTVTAYTLTMYGEYGFLNNKFIKISGSGIIPAVMTFTVDKDNVYTLQSYEVPLDGSEYASSVKEMFPKDLYNRIIPSSDSDRTVLLAQERKYAKNYLESIGRTASIGEYSDLKMEIPDIPDETYNMIFDRYWEYPYWIGTQEKIEDGVRYVYETQWKDYGDNDSMVYLTKYVYGTGEIIRTINVHIDDGEVQSSEEKVLKLVENAVNKK